MDEARIEFLLRAGPPADARYEPALGTHPGPIALATQVVRRDRLDRRGRWLSLAYVSIAGVLVVATVGTGLLLRSGSSDPSTGASSSVPPPSASASPSPSNRRIPGTELQAMAAAWATEVRAGVAIAILLDGQIWVAGDVIHADIGVVRLGAVSRLYLVTTTLQLVDEGKVALDDPVTRFVPDWPRGDEITVRMLISGSSGVAAFGEPLAALQQRIDAETSRAWSADDALAIARSHEPRFDPGTSFSPADTEDALLAEVIAQVTGETASSEIQRRLLDRLELDSTFVAGAPVPPAGSSSSPGVLPGTPEMVRGRVAGASPGTIERVDDVDPDVLAVLGPARGMAATVIDVAQFADMIRLGDAVLSSEARALMALPYEDGGVGGAASCPCVDGTPRAVVIDGPSGAYRARVAWFPDDPMTIAILVDREVSVADMEALVERIYRLVPTSPAP